VKEKPTGNLLFGLGFSSAEGPVVSGSVAQNNLFGTGKALNLQLNSGRINRVYSLSYTNPYFTPDGVSAGFDAYYRRFDASRLALGNYITDTYGTGVRFGYPITEFDRIAFGVGYETISIQTFQNSPQRFIDYVNQYGATNSGVIPTLTYIRDTRDSAIWTTRGIVLRLGGEVAVPGLDLNYYKTQAQLTYFYPITQQFVLKLNNEIGYGGGYNDKELPFFKAYYAGGVNSVRGYAQSSLGPRDQNGVLGGNTRFVSNTELLFPVPGLGGDRAARLSLFFDAGQVWIRGNPLYDLGGGNCTNPTTSNPCMEMRYSAGVGVLWNSPFGPLQVYVAQPLNAKDGDRIQRFQFTFGQVF
jgi:outer membrane protein insertion porin family